MYYCEECRIKKGWPNSIMRSYGMCEICGRTKDCWDRPSSSLPCDPEEQCMDIIETQNANQK